MPLTTKEAARRLGISQMAVGQAIRRGSLKAARFGTAYAIDPKELEYYAAYISRPRAPR